MASCFEKSNEKKNYFLVKQKERGKGVAPLSSADCCHAPFSLRKKKVPGVAPKRNENYRLSFSHSLFLSLERKSCCRRMHNCSANLALYKKIEKREIKYALEQRKK
ncbi:MAG: hypothetical protein V1722_02830 [Candidatus Micrarchaeota archaeon]